MSHDAPIDACKELTGDDEIIAAGIFQAKGAALKRGLGAAVGEVAGALLPGNGWDKVAEESVGAAIGTGIGVQAGKVDGVYSFVIAVSPSKVYVFNPLGKHLNTHHIHQGDMELVHTYDRDRLQVTVKARTTVRTIELLDVDTHEMIELEGRRLGWSHDRSVLEQLVGHDLKGEAGPETEAAPEAADA